MKNIIQIILITLSLHVAIYASGTVGSITALRGDVKINDASTSKKATLGLELYEKNNILTGQKSKAQFIFNDETIVTVGKNSNFSISKYMDDDLKESTIELGLVKGAIKTITGEIGKIAPQKFSVKTKTATIGIRGTNFTTSLLEDKSLMAYCTYGAISVNFKEKDYLVKQGFYILISPDGIVEVKEFDSEQLKIMSERFFGVMRSPRGKTNKDSMNDENGVIIDETTEVVTGVIITDVTEEVQAKEQTDKQDNADKSGQTSPVADIIMSGRSVARNANLSAFSRDVSSVNFTIINDSTFDPTSTLVDIDTDGGQWTYILNSTPTSYTSRDNFETNFVSVTVPNDSLYTNFSIDPAKNYFRATSDLAPDDYMSWGEWGATVNHDYAGNPDTIDMDGFWVAGEPTDAAVVAAMTGIVNYAGQYQLILENGIKVNGAATMQIDFASISDQVSLSIPNYDNSGTNASFSMLINVVNGNTMSGSQSVNGGRANGTFYGPTADSVGGNFVIKGDPYPIDGPDATGVYQVKQQ